MKAVIRASIFAGGFLAVMISTAELAMAAKAAPAKKAPVVKPATGRVINDSLVENLRCQNLNVDSIYRAIREDAFSEARNMDIENWGYSSGGFPLANCWALSSTQRMFSYLARYNQPNTMGRQARLEMVSNQVRRAIPSVQSQQGTSERGSRSTADERIVNRDLKKFSVFPVEGPSLAGTYEFWWELRAGYDMNLSRRYTVKRSFREDVQHNQTNHFFRMGNVGMGLGSGATSPKENYESLKTMMRNADGKRLTLVNLRMARTNQHVVMIKSYKKISTGDVVFTVYDSNQPLRDQELIYNVRSGTFTSHGIAKYYSIPLRPMGLFIVDEEERQDFEVAMLNHYRSACK